MKRQRGWLTNEGAVALILIAMVVVILFGVYSESTEKEAFMNECRQDRKQYECEAMWRGTKTHTTPMPIIIHR